MCNLFKRKKSAAAPGEYQEGANFIRMDGLSMRAPKGDFSNQLDRLHANLEKRIGIPISRSAVVRHAVALADERYSNEVGIGGY